MFFNYNINVLENSCVPSFVTLWNVCTVLYETSFILLIAWCRHLLTYSLSRVANEGKCKSSLCLGMRSKTMEQDVQVPCHILKVQNVLGVCVCLCQCI